VFKIANSQSNWVTLWHFYWTPPGRCFFPASGGARFLDIFVVCNNFIIRC